MISAAIIASTQEDLNHRIARVAAHVPAVHIDVMDGRFVQARSNFCFAVKLLPFPVVYEAHLMVDFPGMWISQHVHQFETVIPHFERVKNPLDIIAFVHGKEYAPGKKCKVGFALSPETLLGAVVPYLEHIDRVLIMTVQPGQYGAPFVESTIDKIAELRKIYGGRIQVDGHQDPVHARLCAQAGATDFAVGSYLQNGDVKEAVRSIEEAIRL